MSAAPERRVELPLPTPDEETAPFWEGCRRGVLLLQRCEDCGDLRQPPLAMCPECGSLEQGWQEASGRGEVYSYVVTHQAIHPALAGRVPFATVLVQLEEGALVTSNLVDCPVEEIRIGMPVAVEFVAASDEVALPMFRRI